MNRFACLCPFLFFYLVVLVVPSNSGEYETIDDGKSVLIEDPTPIISPYADFRLRYETDWDSARANGSLRDDRMRARIRARLGAKIEPTENLTFNIRARTGNSDSQQSPHLTIQDFNGGERDDFDGILDLYYGQY
ncbi:MAG: putative porin, partial [Verrucomicrobiota bacterium]